MNGDYFLGAVLATCLTKIVLHAKEKFPEPKLNQLKAECLLIMTSVIRIGQSKFVSIPIDEDSYTRVLTCIRVLCNSDASVGEVFAKHCRQVYSKMVHDMQARLII